MASIDRLIRAAGGAACVSVIVDVGACDGVDSLPVARRHPRIRVIAVEPTPGMAQRLRESSADLPNVSVVEAAVGMEEGPRAFNVFSTADELNSLHAFTSDATEALGAHEPDSRPLVEVRRLSSICDDLSLDHIDVLHVDTQASDLDVLRSLDEERTRRLLAGVVEVAHRHLLYEASAGRVEVRAVLAERGFRVFRVERVRADDDLEHNYYFRRSSLPELFWLHYAAGECRALLARWVARPFAKMRVALALRTRARRLKTR